MADYTAPNVVRGKLSNLRTGNFVTFVYNPSALQDRKGNNYSEEAIPGHSDPIIRWASGKSRELSFTLELCGVSRILRTGVNLGNGAASNEIDPKGFSIQGELEFFQSLEHPTDPKLAGSDGGPDRVVFTMGPMYAGRVCVLTDLSTNVIEWDPDLRPVRATVQFTLKEISDKSRYANTVWSPPFEGFNV